MEIEISERQVFERNEGRERKKGVEQKEAARKGGGLWLLCHSSSHT